MRPTDDGRYPARLTAALRALRPQQWVKNFLVCIPLLLAHQLASMDKVVATTWAFAAFCACASAAYIVNDLVDRDADRQHPQKCRRPFAAGTLPAAWGPPMAVLLLATAVGVSLWKLPWTFAAILAAYLAATLTYSFWLRRKVLVDVLALAGLYTLRVLAGGAATAVDVSEWLMAFAVFLFLSLAFAKRYAELARLADEAKPAATGRGYALSDLDFIRNVGPTSGYLAVLVFALYVNSDAMRQFYNNRWALWLICPLMLYWISRMWIMAMRRKLAEDPLVFALRDPVSLLVGLLAVALLIVAGRASL